MASTINADNGVVSGSSGVKTTADTSGVLALQSNGSTGVTLDTSLNVGVGTTTPAYKVDITSASDASLLQVKSTAGANNTALRLGIDGNNSFINATGGSTGALQLRTYGTTQATLDASGNLGVATTSPSTFGKVAIRGGITVNAGSTSLTGTSFSASDAANSTFWISHSGGTTNLISDSVLTFWAATSAGGVTERARVDASGNFGVGTTSPSTTDGTGAKFVSSGNVGALQAIFTDAANYTIGVKRSGASGSVGMIYGTSGTALALGANDAQQFIIGTAGQLGIGSSPSYGTSGQVLTSGGSGAAPSWSTPAGGFSAMTVIESSTTFTIPSGKTTLKVTVTGGGGGGGGQGGGTGSSGGSSSVASGTQSISTIYGNGGDGGPANNTDAGGAGGASSGGDINFNGGPGSSSTENSYSGGKPGGNSFFGGGGVGTNYNGAAGSRYGGGGAGSGYRNTSSGAGGGGGGTAIKYLTGLTPGNTLTITIGSGGAGGSGGTGSGGAGYAGVVMIEY